MTAAMPNQPRRGYIDAMKGLGILLVVLGHFEEYYRGKAPLFNASFECIYLFHMAVFCLCSGLVAKFSLRKLVSQQLWLYLLAQALILGFRVVALQENLADQGGVLQNLLLPWRHMWYLYALIFWELSVPLLRALRDRFGALGAVGALGAAVLFGLWGGQFDWPFSLDRVVSFYPFFAFGVLYSDLVDFWQRSAAKRWWLQLGVWVMLVFVYGRWFLSVLNAPEPVYENGRLFQGASYHTDGYTMPDRAAFYLIGLLTALALIAVLGRSASLASLGRRTLPIYILHMPVYALLVQLGVYAVAGDKSVPATVSWVAFAVCGTVSLLASKPVCSALTAVANLWYKTLPAWLAKSRQAART